VIRGVLGGTFTPPEAIAASLQKLSAPQGVFAVLGNQDWRFDAPRVRTALESNGIPVIEDSARPIRSGSCDFWLAGIGDYWEGSTTSPPRWPGSRSGADPRVHTQPGRVPRRARARESHDRRSHPRRSGLHPVRRRPVVPSRFGERYAIGHVVEGGRHLFVSPGLGTSIIPVRFLVPPECPCSRSARLRLLRNHLLRRSLAPLLGPRLVRALSVPAPARRSIIQGLRDWIIQFPRSPAAQPPG